ncbi:MAG: ubiquinone/menaquinone biosynthesis methyltransferase [Dehalococcoidia bacterium]
MYSRIQRLYVSIPRTYEMVNHVLTFGLDILWRRKAALIASSAGGSLWLDAGMGTGDMTLNLNRLADEHTRIVAIDFSLPMMKKARERLAHSDVALILAEATHLPFRDELFDAITLSFASRNIDSSGEGNLSVCLSEFHRVLKPGGVFVNLETSQPRNRWLRELHHIYVKLVVKPVGGIISGSFEPYDYLSNSMRRFYSADELASIIRRSGFNTVSYDLLLFGAAAIHRAARRSM